MTTDEICLEAIKRMVWEVNPDNGAVYSHQAQKHVGGLNTKGYRVATLHLNGERRQVKLHRVVWIAINGIPPLGYVIDHINGKKDDNRIQNLRLADEVLNSNNRRSYKGETNPASKLKWQQVDNIRLHYKSGNHTYKTLAKRHEVSPTLIAKIIRNEIWN